MINFNVDLAVECIKTICDNAQCVTCDKLNGQFVRFPCGHSVCEHCAKEAGECLSCVVSPSASYLVDHPQTARVKNASALLSAFQGAFEIDVNKRQRISDHLKLEKQVFPGCIQAPQKYSNKRKSLNNSHSNNENINQTIFPGEEVIHPDKAKMKKSFQYVQNWLNEQENVHQNIPRKPFGDINVNTQSLLHTRKKRIVKHSKGKTEVNAKKSPYVKRTHVKSISNSNSLLNNLVKGVKSDLDQVSEVNKQENKHEKDPMRDKCDRNESGIVIDDEPIVLDDTQEEVIDKDKLAWIAVLEAAKRDDCEDNQILTEIVLLGSANSLNNSEKNESKKFVVNKSESTAVSDSKGVLFYRKSSLSDPCKLCSNYINNQNNTNTTEEKNKDVSIVINNSAFVTTIKFSQCIQYKQETPQKKSVEIQTSLPKCELENDYGMNSLQKRKIPVNDDIIIPTKIMKPEVAIQSLDVFPTNEIKECTILDSNDCTDILQIDAIKHFNSVVIEDSDVESDMSNENNTFEVEADVHRTSVPETVSQGVLTPMTSETKYNNRLNRPLRGHSPNSTDSSDKENLDPNRCKKAKLEKKQKYKINKFEKC